MSKLDKSWCMDCRWLSVRVSVAGSCAYWCRVTDLRLQGPVTWRQACDRFVAR